MGDHRVTIRIIWEMHGHKADSGEMWLNGSSYEALPSGARDWLEEQHRISMQRYDAEQAEAERVEWEKQQRLLYERLKAKYEGGSPPSLQEGGGAMSDGPTADQIAYLHDLAEKERQAWRDYGAAVVEAELAAALKRCPDDSDLLALKGSLNDTLSPEEVSRLLKDWNATGKVIHRVYEG